jgi:hypothetical protein
VTPARAPRSTPPRKYQFTPQLLNDLRLAYCGNKHKLSASLDRLVLRTGWPKHAFKTEATRQGWSAAYRPWTPDDSAFVREHAGAMRVKDIASHLGRSYESVTARVEAILLVRQTRHGYAPSHLQTLFGAGADKVRHWIEKGLLGASRSYSPEARVYETDVLRFIFDCYQQYDLARVHQEWFKALIFGDMDKEILDGV